MVKNEFRKLGKVRLEGIYEVKRYILTVFTIQGVLFSGTVVKMPFDSKIYLHTKIYTTKEDVFHEAIEWMNKKEAESATR